MKQEMKTYVGTKTIRACKMNKRDYNILRGWEVSGYENPKEEGYIVEYKNNSKPNVEGFEGYISWSPKEPFEEAYRIAETWKDRVKIELEDLENRLNGLNLFLDKINTPNNPNKSLLLLFEQRKVMNTYAEILKERLKEGPLNLK